MLSVDLGRFAATTAVPIAANTPATWTNPGPETAVVALADADALLSLTGDATAEAMFLLLSGAYVRFRLDAGASVSALAVSAGGTLRLTRAGES